VADPSHSVAIVRKLWRYARHRTVAGTIYTIRNPWVLLRRHGTIELTDGAKLPFREENKAAVLRIAFFALDTGVRFGAGAGAWTVDPEVRVIGTPGGVRFLTEGFDPTIFVETFLSDVHFVDFDFRGRAVVEGGAFVGDTGLYYAQRGASVYSFEPDPRSYALAQRNLELNPSLAGSIRLRNWAIGRDGSVDFPIAPGGSGSASLQYPSRELARIRSVSIGTILSEFRLEQPYLLHLDIKGEEFGVVEDDAVGRFERLRIEYSPYLGRGAEAGSRSLERLIERVRQLGFTEVRVMKHNALRYDLREHGTLDARKSVASP
jgi:FkbM family methyltransferase